MSDMVITIQQPRNIMRDEYDLHMRTLPWDSDVYSMLEAFKGLMISAGFQHTSIMQAMSDHVSGVL